MRDDGSMGKSLLVIVTFVLVAVGVWYAVTHLPRVGREPTAAPVETPVSLPPLGAACGERCGVQRWAVKTFSDATRGDVDLHPVPATVESLAALPREPGGAGWRGGDPERRVFVVEGFLAAWDLEADRDYHVIVAGMRDQRTSLIAEIPDPACGGACQSGFAQQYAASRTALQLCVQAPNPEDRPIRVRVTGVGFFDRNHGQAGNAPNYIELHPVLRFECLR